MNASIYFYRTNGTLQSINIDTVVVLESARNYVKFYTPQGYHLVRVSLDAALKQLKNSGFVQINRSFAVAIGKIFTLDKENVYFSDAAEDSLPISKSFYPNLVSQLKIIGEDGETETT